MSIATKIFVIKKKVNESLLTSSFTTIRGGQARSPQKRVNIAMKMVFGQNIQGDSMAIWILYDCRGYEDEELHRLEVGCTQCQVGEGRAQRRGVAEITKLFMA